MSRGRAAAVAAPGDLETLLRASLTGYKPRYVKDAERGEWPYELVWGVVGRRLHRAGSADLSLLEFAAECLIRRNDAIQAIGIVDNATGAVTLPGAKKTKGTRKG